MKSKGLTAVLCVVVIIMATTHSTWSAGASDSYCKLTECSALKTDVKLLQEKVDKLELIVTLLAELNTGNKTKGCSSKATTGETNLAPQSAGAQRGLSFWNTERGFHAHRSTFVTLKKGATVVFDRILLRLGEGYDSKTGVYTCSSAGIYVFSLTFQCSKGDYMEVSIYHNNQYLINIVCDYRIGVASQGSGTVLVRLKVDDKVFAKVSYMGALADGTVIGRGFSSFSGYLLY